MSSVRQRHHKSEPKSSFLRGLGFDFRRSALAEKRCLDCGDPNAPFGVGPPARSTGGWYCGPCWSLQPEAITKNIDRGIAALELEDDA